MLFSKRFSCLFIFLLTAFNACFSQKSYQIQTVAFYNLENLFDTINNTAKKDEWSPMMEIKGNRTAIYKDKLSKLAKVLTEIGHEKNQSPPSIIGVVEIENDTVLNDLIKTSPLSNFDYGIIHHESPDARGIDVGLLYRKDQFTPTYHQKVNPQIFNEGKEVFTRDILWAQGFLNSEKINIIVNHWPSRRGGEKKSSPLRERAAAANLELIQKIRKEEPNAKILSMGDFNDDPTDRSFKKVLKTKRKKSSVKKDDLYNPFEQMFLDGFNTLTYRGNIFLFDQVFFTSEFLTKKKDFSEFRFYKAGIHNPSYMTLQSGQYKGSPKRSFSGSTYLGGYSDHYPVYIYLIKENK